MSGGRIGSMRRALAVIPAVAVAAIMVVVGVGVFLPGSVDIRVGETQPLGASVSGVMLDVTGSLDVRSDLPYDVEDLRVRVVLVVDGGEGDVTLWEEDGVTVPSGGSVALDLSGELFYPPLYTMAMQGLHGDSAVLRFRVEADCGYMAGLIGIRGEADLTWSLTEDGTLPDVTRSDPSPYEVVFTVDGMVDALIPGDASLTIASGGSRLDVALTSEDGVITVDLRSSAVTQSTVTFLRVQAASGNVRAYGPDGEPSDLSADRISDILLVIDRMLGADL